MFEKIKDELAKEFAEICEYVDACKVKKNILKGNINDSKFFKAGIICAISLILTLSVSVNLIMPLTNLTLPMTAATSVALASSIAIGYFGQRIITFNQKKKMQKITNAKTNADILEEMSVYDMEIEKAENIKKVLSEMYSRIGIKEMISRDYPDETHQANKYENMTVKGLERRHQMLGELYDKRKERLNILTSVAHLKKAFNIPTKKAKRLEAIISNSLSVSTPILLIGFMLASETLIPSEPLTFLAYVKFLAISFSPTLVTSLFALPYFNKRAKDIENVFNNLNQSLGENALSEELDVEYGNELDDMIEATIEEIVQLGIELKETSYALEQAKSTQGVNETEKTLQAVSKQIIQLEQPEHATVDISWVQPYLEEDIEDAPSVFEESGPRLVIQKPKNSQNL